MTLLISQNLKERAILFDQQSQTPKYDKQKQMLAFLLEKMTETIQLSK